MPIAQSFLAEFEAQAPVTRKFLERLPNNKLTWKPHPRSLTAGQLAYHLAFVPGGVVRGAQKNQIPPPDFQFPQPATVQEVLDAVDTLHPAIEIPDSRFADFVSAGAG